MRNVYRVHRRPSKARSVFGGAGLAVLLCVGVYGVYAAIGWFRGNAAATTAAQAVAETVVPSSANAAVVAPVSVASKVPLVSIGGDNVGTVERSGDANVMHFYALAILPPLAEGTHYEMWMVKKGLADVKSIGAMTPRADGSVALSWDTAGLVNFPLEYTSVVVMRQPNSGSGAPSGDKIAEANFGL